MAGEKILTDAQCKAAKPKQKIYYLNDGNGLRLRVSPNGSKWLEKNSKFSSAAL